MDINNEPIPSHVLQESCHWPSDASTTIIQHLKFIQNDLHELKMKAKMSDEKNSAILAVQDHMLRILHRLTRKKKKRKTQRQPNRQISSSLNDNETTDLVHLPAAVKANMIMLLNELTVSSSLLLDKLIEQDCLSEDECEYIRGLPTTKDQARTLVKKLMGRGPTKIKHFLKLIEEDKPYIVEKIKQSLENIKTQSLAQECAVCLMVKMVAVKDIADSLFQQDIISDDLHSYMTETENVHRYRQVNWTRIITCINTAKQPATAKLVLTESLEAKYRDLTTILKQMPSELPLECTCHKNRTYRTRHGSFSGSHSDLSECPRMNVPNLSDIDTSDTDHYGSLDPKVKDQIYANKEAFTKDQTEFTATMGESCYLDTTCSEPAEHGRTRHRSGQFIASNDEQLESMNSLPMADEHQSLNAYSFTGANGNANKNQRPVFYSSKSNASTVIQSSEGEESMMSISASKPSSPDGSTAEMSSFPGDERSQNESHTDDDGTQADIEEDAFETKRVKKRLLKVKSEMRMTRYPSQSKIRKGSYHRQTSLPSSFEITKSRNESKCVGKVMLKTEYDMKFIDNQIKTKLHDELLPEGVDDANSTETLHDDKRLNVNATKPINPDKSKTIEISTQSGEQLMVLNKLQRMSTKLNPGTDVEIQASDVETDGAGEWTM